MIKLNPEHIFHEARVLPPAEQAAYLRGACADDVALRSKVEGLLRADIEAGSFMEAIDPETVQATLGTPGGGFGGSSAEQAGQMIGRYKLLQQIGEGGFGTVWMAEQREPVKRRVALKIIKLGMDTRQVIARFEAERQALAMMDHPNIAKVLDAGSTEAGRPYFVMEYIRGVPIIEYCDTEKPDTEARLNLFTSVCHAIQHAHQKGIIHRDIKPSNVLITLHDGVPVPKVIDFGIAKATNQELTEKTLFTQHRQMIGTPAYMSPEQAEMSGLDIDTRSDIYSLGVLLYEMLTGTTPFDAKELMSKGFAQMMKVIRETEPDRPSTRLNTMGQTLTAAAQLGSGSDAKKLGSLLRGDLDWIVMKCLEKDRSRRYETASAIAEDLRRHLADEPVVAGPPTARYRLQKLVRRNKGAFAAAAAVFLVLALGVVGTGVGLVMALNARTAEASQRRVAEERFEAAQEYVTTVAEDVFPSVQRLIGATNATQSLTIATTEFLDSLSIDATDSLELRWLSAKMYDDLSDVQGSVFAANFVGDFKKSLEASQRALEIIQTIPPDYPNIGERYIQEWFIRDSIANAQSALGDKEGALSTFQDLERFMHDVRDRATVDPLPARSVGFEHLADVGRAWHSDELDFGQSLFNFRIGHIYMALGDYESALARYEATALPVLAVEFDPHAAPLSRVHTRTVVLGVMADVLDRLDRLPEASSFAARDLEVTRVKAQRAPNNARFARDLVSSIINVVQLRLRMESFEGVESLATEAVGLSESLLERDPSNAGFIFASLSTLDVMGDALSALAGDPTMTDDERAAMLVRAIVSWDRCQQMADSLGPNRNANDRLRELLQSLPVKIERARTRSESLRAGSDVGM